MGKHFLDRFDWLSSKEKSTLAALGADSPAALWAMIDASPEPFVRTLGKIRTEQLLDALWQLTPVEERRILEDRSFTPLPPLGVAVDETGASLLDPGYDIRKRDLLYQKLKELKREHGPHAQLELERVEHELRTLLEGKRIRDVLPLHKRPV
jgi:hypothetical protein